MTFERTGTPTLRKLAPKAWSFPRVAPETREFFKAADFAKTHAEGVVVYITEGDSEF